MDLIYYYPSGMDAPATVAKNVFRCLHKRRKELPFENLKLFVPSKYAKDVQERFSDLEVITYRNLNNVSKNSVIHIPITPSIYPNSKLLLHLFALLKRKKLILQIHGDTRLEMQLIFKYDHHLDIFWIPSYVAQPYLLKSADRLITHSYIMSDIIESYGIKDTVVIPNGIDYFWLDEANTTHIELDGHPNLFYHGRHTYRKGVHLLVKGFANAIGNSSAKLYITGEEPRTDYLRKLCAKLGIKKNVVFLGFINNQEIKSYLNNVDASIYPSIWDNYPLSFIEAFGSAKGPVYFSKLAGIYDFAVRDGYNLNAFEPTVENISKIIKNVIDGNYDELVVKQQKEFAKQYTWDKVIEQYIKMYKEILK